MGFFKSVTLLLLLSISFMYFERAQAVDSKPKQFDHGIGLDVKRPFNIAHRGTSGLYPEHTAAAYQRAVDDGADLLECDITITKDLKLVCRHESNIGKTTNVASISKFLNRKKTYLFDGVNVTDWFTFDFTLAEIFEIKAVQTISFRDMSFNDNFTIVTFDEYISIVKNANRPVGIYPEIKNPSFINSIPGLLPNGTRFEDIVIQELKRHGYSKKEDGCMVQAFEEESLVYLKDVVKTEIPLVMCLWIDVDDSVLDRWRDHQFYGVCCWKDQIYRNYKDGSYKNYNFETTNFAQKCFDRGFKLHVYTFRNEAEYLAWDYGQDIKNEYDAFLKLNVDGYFTDFPATLDYYLDNIYSDSDKESDGDNINCVSASPKTFKWLETVILFLHLVLMWKVI